MRRKNPYKKPLGVVLTLGGLLFLGLFASFMGPARQGFVWDDYKTLKGTYLGTVYRNGQARLVLNTTEGPMIVQPDKSLDLKKLPPTGSLVELNASAQDPEHPRLLSLTDIKALPSTNIKLIKESSGPWIVEAGWALNGNQRFRTALPDGEYQNLYGIRDGRRWVAVD